MGDLLEYFEARSRSLDEEGQPYLDTSTLQFISLIKFNGVAILLPVVSLIDNFVQLMLSHKKLAFHFI